MVRELGFINDSKERKKAFEGRSETLLKQTRELATLCDTRACIVIHNPDDPIKPWRIWPENEYDLRAMVELYKSKNVGGCKELNSSDGKGKMGVKISRTRSVRDGGNGLNGLSAEEVKNVLADVERKIADVQERIDSKTGRKIEDGNHEEQDLAVVETQNDKDAIQSSSEQCADDVVATATTSVDSDIDGYYFAGKFWEENEVFDVDELLTLCEEGESGHCLVDSDKNTYLATGTEPDEVGMNDVYEFFKDLETAHPSDEGTSFSLSVPVPVPAPAVGTKRNVEQVFSFTELMAPSSQRQKVSDEYS